MVRLLVWVKGYFWALSMVMSLKAFKKLVIFREATCLPLFFNLVHVKSLSDVCSLMLALEQVISGHSLAENALYGSESWPLTKSDEKLFLSFERTMYYTRHQAGVG